MLSYIDTLAHGKPLLYNINIILFTKISSSPIAYLNYYNETSFPLNEIKYFY